MTKLEKFIRENEDWLEKIQKFPYNILVKEYGDYRLFKYNQLAEDTDWFSPIVQECRGIILNKNNEIVCHAFDRFFNYGEPYAVDVDFDNCRILEKVDGSIIKLWADENGLHISTNGSINAYEIKLSSIALGDSNISFGDKVEEILKERIDLNEVENHLKENHSTAIFELICPENQVVVYYAEADLVYLGSRNLDNNCEYHDNYFNVCTLPKLYDLNGNNSISAIKDLVDTLKGFEGVVVVDSNYNRVKVKNADYLIAHHNLKAIKDIDLVKVILNGEVEEYKATLVNVEFRNRLDNINNTIHAIYAEVDRILELDGNLNRKDFALKYKNHPYSTLLFKGLNGRNYKEGLLPSTLEKIILSSEI